ncbi:MAG TPA: Spy/CpxP family protein refolding chaperone, partial [Longimicrobiales bacterium]|nr:Spy/CpxP family protein refolding chaperone [Longimicrobiales bacterium]
QHEHVGGATPYADLVDREIKALAPEEIEQLLAGEGMGMALAAELNGLPGPRHVLELADELELEPEGREEVRRVFDAMEARAQELGALVVDEERALDRAFASGTVTATEIDRRTARIAGLRGELRAAHLSAHLSTAALLSDDQRHRYAMLRGYHGGR